MVINGVPCCDQGANLTAHDSDDPYMLTFEYSNAQSMTCYTMSTLTSNIHLFIKEGKI